MKGRLRLLHYGCGGYVLRNLQFLNALASVLLLELVALVLFEPTVKSHKIRSLRSDSSSEIRKVLVLDTKTEVFVSNVAC